MSRDAQATLDLQREFARHLRDPSLFPAPEGLEDRRVQIYRELFFNNIESLLAINFPVIRKLLGDQRWQRLVRDFYREHTAHTPLFPELGRELQRYLESRVDAGRGDPAFLVELAHYEWAELALSLDEHDITQIAHAPDGDIIAAAPVLSPLAWAFTYRWPVHRLSADFQPDVAPSQPTQLLLVRSRRGEVSFLEISPLARVLFDLLKENPGATGLDLAEALAEALPQMSRDTLIEGACQSLRDFRRRDIVLGTEIES